MNLFALKYTHRHAHRHAVTLKAGLMFIGAYFVIETPHVRNTISLLPPPPSLLPPSLVWAIQKEIQLPPRGIPQKVIWVRRLPPSIGSTSHWAFLTFLFFVCFTFSW